jgi:hypothetical protein
MAGDNLQQARLVFISAISFHETALRCWMPAPGLTILPYPMIVSAAFACELYLKVALTARGIRSREHELNKLFNRLDNTDKAAITGIYERGSDDSDVPLQQSLLEVGKAFTDWRYAHELDSSHVRFGALARLSQALLIWLCRTYPQFALSIDGGINRLLRVP